MDEYKEIRAILAGISPELAQTAAIRQLAREEDGCEPYDVWLLEAHDRRYILKKAKEYEAEVYRSFLSDKNLPVPKLLGTAVCQEAKYLLLEFVGDHNLQKASRKELRCTLDALILLQEAYWGNTQAAHCAYDFSKSLSGRENRGKYLGGDPRLEQAYSIFLEAYRRLPRTLCHDDLLPFNVQLSDHQAYLIDWEYGGILPYPTSLARLLAHGEDGPNALFYLTDSDRQFAVHYYFEHLVQKHGISYDDYRDHLELFFFYEYCEWVYIGHRYDAVDGSNYRKYLPLAISLAEKILSKKRGLLST